MTATLATTAVMSIQPGHEAAGRVTFGRRGDESAQRRLLLLEDHLWEAMGRPTELTVTVQPGNALGPQPYRHDPEDEARRLEAMLPPETRAEAERQRLAGLPPA